MGAEGNEFFFSRCIGDYRQDTMCPACISREASCFLRITSQCGERAGNCLGRVKHVSSLVGLSPRLSEGRSIPHGCERQTVQIENSCTPSERATWPWYHAEV